MYITASPHYFSYFKPCFAQTFVIFYTFHIEDVKSTVTVHSECVNNGKHMTHIESRILHITKSNSMTELIYNVKDNDLASFSERGFF